MCYVRKTTPNCFIYKECNSIPLYLTRLLRMVKFWLKIISLNNMSPAKLLYNTALEMSINSESIVSSWIHEVKNILFRYGFGYVWLNQHLANDYPFFNAFKIRVTDVFWQENNTNIMNLSKNRLYRHLSNNSSFYLENLPNNHIRKSLTKLRLGSHYVMIERGRWKNLELVDRICFKCNEVEDEYHVVMCCSKYKDLRKKYLPKELFNRPSMFKFIEFINCENIRHLRNLGLFVYNVFKQYEKDEIYE